MTTTAPGIGAAPRWTGPPLQAAYVSRAWRVHAAGFTVFVATALLSRATVLDGSTLSLLWPAGGVAAAWLFFLPRAHRWLALALLAVATTLAHVVTGAAPGEVAALVASNVVQAWVFVLVLDRGCPELWGPRGSVSLAGVVPLSWVTGAAAAAALAGVTVGASALYFAAPHLPPHDVAVWLGRNFAGVLSVFAVVHLAAHRLVGDQRSVAVPLTDWIGTAVVTLLVYVPVFAQDGLSMAFVALASTLWVGLRCDAVLAAAHALLGGAIAVGFTLAGSGPFALTTDQDDQALLMQLFLTSVLVSGLYLSAAREERARIAALLAVERQRLEEQAELLEQTVEHVTDGLLVLDSAGSVLRANAAGRRLAGALDGAVVRRALAGESVRRHDVGLHGPDGTLRVLEVDAIPLTAGEARVMARLRDVTDQRAQVDELAAFAAVVAHDLRGPLGALQGWAELAGSVTGPDPEPDLVMALDRIRSGATRLGQLVESLLLHATTRDRQLERVPVALTGIVEEVAHTRGIESRVQVVGAVPPVLGDRVLLRHLVDNLVGNAVKYVADGVVPHVVVAGVRRGDRVEVTVTDNGIGVPPALRHAVFHRFERVPGTGRQGTGLGLSICQTIVERHGGTIEIDDGPGGRGSVFRVVLPAA